MAIRLNNVVLYKQTSPLPPVWQYMKLMCHIGVPSHWNLTSFSFAKQKLICVHLIMVAAPYMPTALKLQLVKGSALVKKAMLEMGPYAEVSRLRM